MILLDPGHPNQSLDEDDKGYGAVYRDDEVSLIEKNLTLDICRKVKQLADGQNAMAQLTRSDDSPVSLADRCRMVDDYKTECFVSVHFNWFRTEEARGSTIFAEPEKTPSHEESQRLSQCLQQYFSGYARIPHRRVRITDSRRDDDLTPYMYVLSNTDCPAVLLELLFLSNPEDRAVILDDRKLFVKEYAQTIFGGIRHWQLTGAKKN